MRHFNIAALTLLALVLGVSTSPAEEKSIRVGVITNGDAPHLGIYLSTVARAAGVSKVAFVDSSGKHFKRAQQAYKSKLDKAYRNDSLMYQQFKPDLVVIALPAHLAPTAIHNALKVDCHVVAEKPACVRVGHFAELVRIAKRKKKMLMLSLPSRVSPRTLRARQIIKQGLIGKLYSVQVLSAKDQARLTRPSYQKSWFAYKNKSGGGHLAWLAIHQLDQALFIVGQPVTKVAAFCKNVGGQPVQIEDAEALTMQFKNGMVGTLHGGYFLKSGSMEVGTTIWGSHGWIRMSSHRGPRGTKRSFQWFSTHPKAPKGLQTEDPTSKVDGYQAFIQSAIDAARGLRPAPLSPEDSLNVLKVIHAAYRSSESGIVQKLGK